MVNALAAITASGSDFGADVTISWTLPTTLPTAWQLYVFKKAGSAVSDVDIAAYLAGTLKPDDLSTKGIFVFYSIPNGVTKITDLSVSSGVKVYYSGVIQDTGSKDFSSTVTTNFTPTPKLVINTMDSKGVIVRGTEKMIDVLRTIAGNKLVIGKDLKVLRGYPMDKGVGEFIIVQRMAGRPIQRQLGDEIYSVEGTQIKAEMDTDNFEVHWVSVEPLRRDKLTDVFRAGRQIIRKYVLMLGNYDIKDARFVFSGDSEGKLNDGTLVYRGIMNIQIDLETQVQIGEVAALDIDYVPEYVGE